MTTATTTPPIIQVLDLKKHFSTKPGFFSHATNVRAVDGLDFSVSQDGVFSIVGESGCGKSTVARLVLRLTEPTSGSVLFKGTDITPLAGDSLKAFRRSVQIVFQDPFASLNPRRTVYETLSEPMKIHGIATKRKDLEDRVAHLLSQVGLSDIMGRYPHEFSGGQRQRICIARALSVGPELIVADEPLSALDVSIQAQIINLLMQLKASLKLSFIFISHDLRVVRYLSDHVAVMYLGKIVEHARCEDLFNSPLHPYTEILLSSVPSIHPSARSRTIMGQDVPSPLNIPPGCPFHPRCPKRFEPCDNLVPKLTTIQNSRSVACHLHTA